jgi:hypothetical protein
MRCNSCECCSSPTPRQLYQEACYLCTPLQHLSLPFLTNTLQEALRHLLDIDNLYAKAEHLQDIAYKTEGKNRVIGSKGHDDTVAFIKETLEQFPDYYTVKLQGVPLLVGVSANLTANNKSIEVFPATLAPAGKVSGPLVAVPNLGCEEVRSRSQIKSSPLKFDSRTSPSPSMALLPSSAVEPVRLVLRSPSQLPRVPSQ